jgi:6-pyruvoyltetrahydropterin/6-carboxytetrahydropterin synthase
MIIRKDYRFYAAHRNEELSGKCRNLHGHRYGLRCFFEVRRSGSISTLFADFDEKVDPLLKEQYDHAMLINIHDPLFETLRDHSRRTGESFKLKRFTAPTSVENLAYQLFSEISAFGFQLVKIEVRETDTSVLSYTRKDWLDDRQWRTGTKSVASAITRHSTVFADTLSGATPREVVE